MNGCISRIAWIVCIIRINMNQYIVFSSYFVHDLGFYDFVGKYAREGLVMGQRFFSTLSYILFMVHWSWICIGDQFPPFIIADVDGVIGIAM